MDVTFFDIHQRINCATKNMAIEKNNRCFQLKPDWDPGEHSLNWGTFWGEFWGIVFSYFSFESVKYFSYPGNKIWRLFCFLTDVPTNRIEFQIWECFSAEILFSEDNARSNFLVYLRTFEEHLKKQIQDPRNIEHFLQVWHCPHTTFKTLSTRLCCMLFVSLIL